MSITHGARLPPAGAPTLSPIPTKYHWPASLLLPPRPPMLVYLDLNHWIELAKAHSGHPGGGPFRDALDACIAAVDHGTAVFPLADAIYYEVSRIASRRQRSDLADVMERDSRYAVVTSRSVIADHEVEALLDRLIGPGRDPVNRMAYLDHGVFRAFGKIGGVRVYDRATGEDVTDEARARHPLGPDGFDAMVADADRRLNRSMIEGPTTDEEEADLRSRGWNPFAAHDAAQRRAQQEIDQAARLAAEPEWRRGRTRDVIAAREVVVELMRKFDRGIADRGARGSDVFADDRAARMGFVEMPSYDVAVTMKTSRSRRRRRRRWCAGGMGSGRCRSRARDGARAGTT